MSDFTVNNMLARFGLLYGPPTKEPQAAKEFVGEYAKALDGTDPVVLAEAADLIIKQHTYRNWPTVGECVKAVETVATRRNLQRECGQWGKASEAPRQEPTAEARARVDAMMRECMANLKVRGPAPAKAAPLPDVSKNAWEARFGKPRETA